MSDDDKRYAPPATEVADVRTGPPHQPPVQVVWAVRLLWASLAVSVLAILVISPPAGSDAATNAVGYIVQGGVLALQAWLTLCIGRAKHWARVVYLVLFLLSLVLMALIRVPEGTPMLESVFNVVTTLLDGAGMYLVFMRPGSDWFKAAA